MKNLIKKLRYLLPVLPMALPLLVQAATGGLPIGQAVTFEEISYLTGVVANFIIGLSGVIMIGSIVVSGLMIMTSGNNPDQFKKGQTWLRHAIWGSVVVLAAGVIINTVAAVVDRTFFCQVSVVGICLWF